VHGEMASNPSIQIFFALGMGLNIADNGLATGTDIDIADTDIRAVQSSVLLQQPEHLDNRSGALLAELQLHLSGFWCLVGPSRTIETIHSGIGEPDNKPGEHRLGGISGPEAAV